MNQPDFARHWALQLSNTEDNLVRLHGGINNHVYRCGSQGRYWVIKGYPTHQVDQRDRMQAEVEFLQFAAQAAPGFTPALIQIDQERRCVVLEHLEGEAFPEGVQPSEAAGAEAVEFFRQLNAKPRLARESIQLDAAEGFLRLREHLWNVRERIDGMTCVHLDPELQEQAETLLQQLRRKLDHIEELTIKTIDQGLVADAIDPDERCVSPSDFGFHNAIRTTTRTRFIDFEFAGWDDPAKALLDFIYQPRIQVAGEVSPLLKALHPDQRRNAVLRCASLKPVLQIKWLCIMLAVLRPERLEQILSANPEINTSSLVSQRLRSASMRLNRGLNIVG